MSQYQASIIIADLKRMAGAFDFTGHGLGRIVMSIAAQSVTDNVGNQCDDDGNGWPALSEDYDAWKQAHLPGPMAVLYGNMADPGQVAGQRDISKDSAMYIFGVTEQAMQEAVAFQEGNGAGQPARPFVGLNAHAIDRADAVFDEEFRRAVEG